MGPFQIRTFAHPPQGAFSGTAEWMDILAIHEYRHAMQFAKATGGVSDAMRFLMGDLGWALGVFICQPMWFLEGDAVNTETALTGSGRGRHPGFLNRYRALALSEGEYSYDKAQLNSYRDYVPTFYHLGYHMVNYGRRYFGRGVWDLTLERAQDYVFFYALSNSLKKETGISTRELYRLTMDELRDTWTGIDKTIERKMGNFPKSRSVSPPKGEYTSYTQPHLLGDDIVFLGNSYSMSARVLDREGNVLYRGFGRNFTGDIDIAGDRITWTERIPHIRWDMEDYSDVYVWDGRYRRRLTKGGKYFSPALSPDGQRICAVSHRPLDDGFAIHIIESSTGAILEKLPNPDGYQIIQPIFADDGIISVVAQEGRHGLALWRDGGIELLNDWDRYVLQSPVFHDGKVFFHASYGYNFEIYSLDLKSRELVQVTQSRFSSREPFIHGDSLFFASYTSDGDEIRAQLLQEGRPFVIPEESPLPFYSEIAAQERETVDSLPDIEYDIKRFHRFPGDYPRLHSWSLYWDTQEIGLQLEADNLMRDFSLFGMYGYNYEKEYSTYYGQGRFSQLWPVLRGVVRYQEAENDSGAKADLLAGGGLSIPLTLYQGSCINYVEPALDFYMTDDGQIRESYALSFSVLRYGRMTIRDFNPPLGQQIYGEYRSDLEGKSGYARARAMLFFPGLFKHHSLYGTIDYGEHFDSGYHFSLDIEDARGFDLGSFDNAMSVSVNYEMPLFYPDLAVSGIYYIRRVRLGGFYDYTRYSWRDVEDDFSSVGVTVDLNGVLFRVLDGDIRFFYAHPVEDGEGTLGLIIGK